jgi:hypothetical protein
MKTRRPIAWIVIVAALVALAAAMACSSRPDPNAQRANEWDQMLWDEGTWQ